MKATCRRGDLVSALPNESLVPGDSTFEEDGGGGREGACGEGGTWRSGRSPGGRLRLQPREQHHAVLATSDEVLL